MKKLLFLSLILFGLCALPFEAKKIRNVLKIEKESNRGKEKESFIDGKKINLSDTLYLKDHDLKDEIHELLKVAFAGYEKEAGSSKESFIMINPSCYDISGIEIRIKYSDLQGRMFHSRNVKESCYIPSGETRRFDIKSWDTQHTYYYYLGNEPKRVATPFQVSIEPVSIWIMKDNE